MAKYKIGDIVKIIQRKSNNTTGSFPDCTKANGNVGEIAKITDIHGDRPYCLDSLDGNSYFGWFDEDDIELYQGKIDTNKFIYVECIKPYINSSKIKTIYKRRISSDIDSFEYNNQFAFYCSATGNYFLEHFKPSTERAYFAQFESKPESDVLPEKWYFKVTPENYEEFKHLRYLSRSNLKGYILSKPVGGMSWGYWQENKPLSYTEISFDTFRKHILNKHHPSKKEDKFKVGDYCYKDGFIFIKVPNNPYNCDNYAIRIRDKTFFKGNAAIKNTNDNPARHATEEEKAWLDACIKAGKYVELNSSPKETSTVSVNFGELDLEEWLIETKKLNLSLEQLTEHIKSSSTCHFHKVFKKLNPVETTHSIIKAEILYYKWNGITTEDPIKKDIVIPEFVKCVKSYGRARVGDILDTSDESLAEELFSLTWKQVLIDFKRLHNEFIPTTTEESSTFASVDTNIKPLTLKSKSLIEDVHSINVELVSTKKKKFKF